MIDCIITASRRFSADLPQGRLEVPCALRFKGEPKDVKKLFTLSNEKPQPEFSQLTKKKENRMLLMFQTHG